MKKLLVILLAMSMTFVFTACNQTDDTEKTIEDNYPQEEVAMWEVTSDESDGKIYLLGTIHAGKEDTFPLRDEIMTAFDESDYLAVEANINAFEEDIELQTELAMKSVKTMMYSDGKKIQDDLGQEVYNEMKNILSEHQLYNQTYDMFKPVFWNDLLTEASIKESSLNTNYGVDTQLLEMAEEDDKEILEVESIEFQMDLLYSFPDELYEMQVVSTVETFDLVGTQLDMLYTAWNTGNMEYVELAEKVSDPTLTEEEAKLIADYNKALNADRNIGMADTAEEYLDNDYTVFYAVGFAHMAGEEGLVELLKERGYTVVRV